MWTASPRISVPDRFVLPGMDPDPHLQPERVRVPDDRQPAARGPVGSGEDREQPVTGGLDLAAAVVGPGSPGRSR